MLLIEETRSLEQWDKLRPDWITLWEQCEDATPFHRPEWLQLWWQHFGQGELRVLSVRENGRLVGLAPLFVSGKQNGAPCLMPVGVGISDYTDFLFAKDVGADAAAAILEYLEQRLHCELSGVRASSALAVASMRHSEAVAAEPSLVVELPPDPEYILKSLPIKLRQTVIKGGRKARSLGYRMETCHETSVDEFLGALFRLHEERWRTKNLPGVLSDARVQQFHREVGGAFWRLGLLCLYAFRSDSHIGGILYGFANRGRFYSYIGGFDPALKAIGPGNLLIHYAIEKACEMKCKEFDFLRGAEPYKFAWGAEPRSNYSIHLGRTLNIMQPQADAA